MRAGTLLVAGLAAGCSAAPGAAYAGGAHQVKPLATSRVNVAPDKTVPTGPLLAVSGAPARVAAKGAILANADTGQVLWSRQASVERPMASITKVMTAYLVIASGDLNRSIRVPKGVIDYVADNGAESDGLHPGEVLTARQLLGGLLVQSGADAAYTLASAYGPGMNAFIAKMNATAKKLGMDHTRFASPDGLPYPTETSTYSTPQDLITLGNAAMKSAEFRSIVDQRQYHVPKGKSNLQHFWDKVTDFGMAMIPDCSSHRNTTWATDFPWASPMRARIGFSNRWLRPSAKGPQDWICTPRRIISSWAERCWKNGWVSTWLMAGMTSLWTMRSTRRSGWKFDTPMARTCPSARSFSMARHAPYTSPNGWWMR